MVEVIQMIPCRRNLYIEFKDEEGDTWRDPIVAFVLEEDAGVRVVGIRTLARDGMVEDPMAAEFINLETEVIEESEMGSGGKNPLVDELMFISDMAESTGEKEIQKSAERCLSKLGGPKRRTT